ncbi:hypothetical protein PYCCODRAFT_1309219 [Trametes coccinea BRFM310]|uniref:Uncharacterized protein n=1 Tax=Trametes coccinea (strain BRFM310) TaxID=1353009 RepID=A0A1Y2I5M8_TRAC3|nr:hypothetical protein PYCCODRAFT_1309219 [Trametes coccinea BRFM310]
MLADSLMLPDSNEACIRLATTRDSVRTQATSPTIRHVLRAVCDSFRCSCRNSWKLHNAFDVALGTIACRRIMFSHMVQFLWYTDITVPAPQHLFCNRHQQTGA